MTDGKLPSQDPTPAKGESSPLQPAPTVVALERFKNFQGKPGEGGDEVPTSLAGVLKGSSPPPTRAEPAVYDPNDLTQAAGTVGALIDWMTASSLYPNRPLAVGAALVTLGTLLGQSVAGPTRGSTHLYVVGLGASGAGKQHGIDCAKQALHEIGASDRIGAGDFRSSVGLVNSLKKQSVFCSFIDEYGLVLQRIGHKGAGGYESDVVNIFQQLWAHNWVYFNSPAAAREKSEQIFAPAFSILGLSVPEHFYGALSLKQIAGGLLNRHLSIRGEDRPRKQKPANESWNLPAALKQRLQALYRPRPKSTAEEIVAKPIDDTSFEPMVTMRWGSAAAEKIWDEFEAKIRDEPDQLRKDLFARTPEMMVRIATIVAFGRGSLVVDETDMLWARDWVLKSSETLHEGVLKYTVDVQDFPGLCKKMLDCGDESGWISKRLFYRKVKNWIAKGGDADAVIKHLIHSEEIEPAERAPTGGKSGRPRPGWQICKD